MRYNHFFPKRLLRGFADAEGWLHVYEIETGDVQRVHVNRAGGISGLYSDEVEETLNNSIERQFNSRVLRKLHARELLDTRDIEIVVDYILSLQQRVPSGRDQVNGLKDEVAAARKAEMLMGVRAQAQAQGLQPSELQDLERELDAVYERVLSDKTDWLWHGVLLLDKPLSTARLRSMKWDAFLVPAGKQLLTCDNPVLHTRAALSTAQGKLAVPVSSSMALQASIRPGPAFRYSRMNSQDVHEMNRAIAYQAQQFIYFARNETWVVPCIQHARR